MNKHIPFLGLIFTITNIYGMTPPAPEKKKHTVDILWEKFKNEGPLEKLSFTKDGEHFPGFEKVKVDKKGRVVGWLTVPDQLPLGPGLPEAVYVAINLHRDGYTITFIEGYGNKLPDGLYLWRSVNSVRLLTPNGTLYKNETPEHTYAWLDPKGEVFSEVRYWKGRIQKKPLDAFEGMPSVVKAFDGKYRVYLHGRKPHGASVLTVDPKKDQLVHKDMNESQKQKLLSLYSKDDKEILTRWLKTKLQSSGMNEQEIDDLIKHYLVEVIANRSMNVVSYKLEPSLDIYDVLAGIEDLRVCKPKLRKEFNKHLETEAPERRAAVTASAMIECIGGAYQWD